MAAPIPTTPTSAASTHSLPSPAADVHHSPLLSLPPELHLMIGSVYLNDIKQDPIPATVTYNYQSLTRFARCSRHFYDLLAVHILDASRALGRINIYTAGAKTATYRTVLSYAAAHGHQSLAARLLAHADHRKAPFTDKEIRSALFHALGKGDAAILGMLTQARAMDLTKPSDGAKKYTPMQKAASSGKLESVKFLLEKGCPANRDVGYTTMTPLLYAVRAGDKDIVELLLDHGASLYDRVKYDSVLADRKDWNPFCYVVSEAVKEPLSLALAHGRLEVAKLLAQRGAIPKGLHSKALVHVAFHAGRRDIIAFLFTCWSHLFTKAFCRTPSTGTTTHHDWNAETIFSWAMRPLCHIESRVLEELALTPEGGEKVEKTYKRYVQYWDAANFAYDEAKRHGFEVDRSLWDMERGRRHKDCLHRDILTWRPLAAFKEDRLAALAKTLKENNDHIEAILAQNQKIEEDVRVLQGKTTDAISEGKTTMEGIEKAGLGAELTYGVDRATAKKPGTKAEIWESMSKSSEWKREWLAKRYHDTILQANLQANLPPPTTAGTVLMELGAAPPSTESPDPHASPEVSPVPGVEDETVL